jgi:thioredoxin-like negative regulator of GroEL
MIQFFYPPKSEFLSIQSAAKYQIMSIPMQIFSVNGEKVDEILGAVPEPTIRTMVDGILQNFPTDETGRLGVILTSWVKPNKKHQEKFSQWLRKANQPESNPVYAGALEASQASEKANEMVFQASVKLQEKG